MGKRKKKSKTLSPGERLVDAVFRPWRLLLLALCGLLTLFAGRISDWLPDPGMRPEYQVSLADVRTTPLPAWVPEDLVRQVFDRAELEFPVSLQEPDLIEKVAAAFHTHPWIEEVRQVRRSYPPAVAVDVVFRTPVAVVEGTDGYYPVDRFGILLPGLDFSPAAIDRYVLIQGVSSVPFGSVGQPWGDEAVTGACQLANALMQPREDGLPWWDYLGLAAVEVPRRVTFSRDLDDLEFTLVSTGGSRILWGRTPETRHPGELSAEQKLARLHDYLEAFGSFDDQGARYVIDIRQWRGIGRSLVAEENRPGQQVR